jgi:hypothetical protein
MGNIQRTGGCEEDGRQRSGISKGWNHDSHRLRWLKFLGERIARPARRIPSMRNQGASLQFVRVNFIEVGQSPKPVSRKSVHLRDGTELRAVSHLAFN